jgi:acetoacetyl-CoA reductase
VFSALRANDLIWQYVVGNYLKGNKPPAFDLLYWNSDATNLPGPFLAWYLRNMYLENNLRVPGKLEMCGVKADLGRVDMPAFIYASREDHIVPWKSAYQSRSLLGGETTFVLGASGILPASSIRRRRTSAATGSTTAPRRTPTNGSTPRPRSRAAGGRCGQLAQAARQRRRSFRRAPAGQQGLPAGRAGAGKLRQGKGIMEKPGSARGARSGQAVQSPDPTINREEKKMLRVALVTGGMGGLGEAICIKLAALGYKVVTTYSPSNTKAQEWLRTMNDMGYGFKAYPCDVADFDSCKACVAQVVKDVGPVEVLVNNAGITRDMTFKKMTKADWDAVIHTNLDSAFNMTKQVMDGMMERGWGRVINISSVNGQKGAFGQTNYAAAKAGMHGFTKALALEVAKKGVTVNTISPGYIGTKMVMAIPQEVLDSKILPQIPQSRLGKPEEVAGLVAYLSSEEAAFVTGANISINGGQHMY